MIKVKISSSENVEKLLEQSPGGKGIWNNCEFFINNDNDNCDYWVILYKITRKEHAVCPPENTIFVTGEPPSLKHYSRHFLNQFSTVLTAQEKMQYSNVIHTHQILPWLLNKNYDEVAFFSPLEKTKTMSIICSNKRFSKGHEERYQFALDLKGYFGNRLDFYGRGIRDFKDKWDTIAPYKYSIAIENYSSKYWVTEKLWENYLSLTYPFYYGCTNIGDYYPSESLSIIDIHNFEGTIDVIEGVLGDSDHYLRHLPYLIEAKKRYLKDYSIFSQLDQVINTMGTTNPSPKKDITIIPSIVGDSKIVCLSMSILRYFMKKIL